MRQIIYTYSILLGERRGLVSQTDALMAIYEKDISKEALGVKACKEGILPNMSWTSTVSLVTRFFAKRYMGGEFSYKPADLFKDLSIKSHRDTVMLYLVFTALVEQPLYDFVTKNYYLDDSKMDIFDKSDVVAFLTNELDSKELVYPVKVVDTLAGGIVATLRHFNVAIETEYGSKHAVKIERPYLGGNVFIALIYFLRKNYGNDHDVVNHKLWKIFDMSSLDVIKRLAKHQDVYITQNAGSLVKISQVEKGDQAIIDVINASY